MRCSQVIDLPVVVAVTAERESTSMGTRDNRTVIQRDLGNDDLQPFLYVYHP